MENKIKEMIATRDDTIVHLNNRIFDYLHPTLLTALVQWFQINERDVDWVDIHVVNDTLVVTCVVAFDVSLVTDRFKSMFDDLDEHNEIQSRILQTGIPVQYAMKPVETILDFIRHVLDTDESVSNEEIMADFADKSIEFDTDSLTQEQLDQIKIFNNLSTTNRH